MDRLSAHRLLTTLPETEVTWIATHGVLRRLQTGEVLTSREGPVDGLHVVLDGHLSIYVDRGTGKRKVMEWRGGDVTGLMPYSRLVSPPGDVAAEEPTELVTVYRENIPEMIHACSELTAALVHVMVDRARHFTSSFLHDEKLVSLGKLSAGLAHELNNPASAIVRSASTLSSALSELDASSRRLGSALLNAEHLAVVENVRDACLSEDAQNVVPPLELERREDALIRWLKARNLDTELAETLAEMSLTPEKLDALAKSLPAQSLDACLHWIAASSSAVHLTAEIREAASRIHHLVDSVKDFTQMDREAVAEPVDISQGLGSTLVVLRSKAKGKAASLTLNVEPNLPLIRGFAGELNQIWANLISNALDAVAEDGRVEVQASRIDNGVVVRVIDNGPGIPEGIRDRIFDPFFTTKPVGEGSGIGLDIVRRLVRKHNGQIELDSVPGRTEFRVILP